MLILSLLWSSYSILHTYNVQLFFRRATLQCLEKKVTPMLAGVIAMADINSNLDILIKNNDDWVHQLWLALLNEDNISEIKYERDLRSASQNAELKELTVRSVSAGNKFACKMPFSWIIYDQMKSILYNAKSGDLQGILSLY